MVELQHLSESTGNGGYIEILKTKKMALANLLDKKVQGALVRSRIQISKMDALSGFFFGLERKHRQRKQIHSLLLDAGQELIDQTRPRLLSFTSHCTKVNTKIMITCLKSFVVNCSESRKT